MPEASGITFEVIMSIISQFIYDFYEQHQAELDALPDYQDYMGAITKCGRVAGEPRYHEIPLFVALIDQFFDAFILNEMNTIPVDLMGHLGCKAGATLADIQQHPLRTHPLKINQIRENIQMALFLELDALICTGAKPIFNFNLINDCLRFAWHDNCEDCGEALFLMFDAKNKQFGICPEMVAKTNSCLDPSESRTLMVTISVPSNQMVFANDLRSLFSSEEVANKIDKLSCNHFSGRKRTTELAAQDGILMAFVGNTSLRILKEKRDLLVATDYGYANYHKLNTDQYNIAIQHPGYQGTIDTALWWYCAMDKQEFINRCEKKGVDPANFYPIVVKIEGNFATLNHFYDENQDDDADSHKKYPAFSCIAITSGK